MCNHEQQHGDCSVAVSWSRPSAPVMTESGFFSSSSSSIFYFSSTPPQDVCFVQNTLFCWTNIVASFRGKQRTHTPDVSARVCVCVYKYSSGSALRIEKRKKSQSVPERKIVKYIQFLWKNTDWQTHIPPPPPVIGETHFRAPPFSFPANACSNHRRAHTLWTGETGGATHLDLVLSLWCSSRGVKVEGSPFWPSEGAKRSMAVK